MGSALRWLLLLAGAVLAASTTAAADDPAAGPGAFEVIVLRGAGVVRVSGDASGAIREETLREDPRPLRREPAAPAAPPPAEPEVVIVVHEAGYERTALPVWLPHGFVPPHGPPHGAKRAAGRGGRPRVARPGD